jgi:hypothetical protein
MSMLIVDTNVSKEHTALKMEWVSFFRNVGIYHQVHTGLQPRRPTSTSVAPWEPQISYLMLRHSALFWTKINSEIIVYIQGRPLWWESGNHEATNIQNNSITNLMEQRSCSEFNSRSVDQETPCLLRSPNYHHCVHRNLKLDPIQSQINSINTFKGYLFHFNIIH